MGSRELVRLRTTQAVPSCSMWFLSSFLALSLVTVTFCSPHSYKYRDPTAAVVQLVAGGDSGVRGGLSLFHLKGGVAIQGKIFGLEPGEHGFHIHMNGSTDNDCKAAGGHFNPDKALTPSRRPHFVMQGTLATS